MYHAGLVIPVIGAAKGALFEFETILRTKNTYFKPIVPRYTVEEYQRHWGQAKALFGVGEEKAEFRLRLKKKHLPLPYLAGVTTLMTLGIGLPYGNEILRCLRAQNELHYMPHGHHHYS